MGMGLRTIPLFGGPRHHDLRRVCTPITINLLAAALLVGSVLLLPSYRYLLVVFKDEDRQQFAYSCQPTKRTATDRNPWRRIRRTRSRAGVEPRAGANHFSRSA